MPRPKRAKPAPSAPVSRVAKTAPIPNLSRQQREIPKQSLGRVGVISDDSEGIVTTSNKPTNRKGVEKREVFMSGGLGVGDLADAHRKPGATRRKPALLKTARTGEQERVIEGLKRRRDAALAAKQAEVQVPSSNPVSTTEDKRPPTRGKGIEVMRTVERVPPGSGLKTQGTPAMETSVLALANFKRRPRQPSILHLVQQNAGIDDDDDENEDFLPDDESTPFIASKFGPEIQAVPSPTPSPSSSQALPEPNSKKRKLTPLEVQVPRSSPPPEVRSSPFTERRNDDDRASSSVHDANEESEEQQVQARDVRDPSPQIWSDTMAPPQSSSPSQQSPQATRNLQQPKSTARPATTKSKRKQLARTHNDEASNDDAQRNQSKAVATTRTRATKATKPQQSLSTAALQSMLPRRRRKEPRDEFDIPSSDAELDTTTLAEDDDELAHLPAKRLGVRKSHANTAAKTSPKKRLPVAKKSAAVAKTPASKGASRTYTRRVSDKENNPNLASTGDGGEEDTSRLLDIGNDSTSTSQGNAGSGRKELRRAAQKFKEVDNWALEFEEITASSSSPWDAR
ncbi:MAG: hypothetical protein M1830_003217 [Pleopsidium flavum]|nr:MAG: hypothetical protein M1830_003217 [Pleopsidium flavum]